jgi:hypothetical protein
MDKTQQTRIFLLKISISIHSIKLKDCRLLKFLLIFLLSEQHQTDKQFFKTKYVQIMMLACRRICVILILVNYT